MANNRLSGSGLGLEYPQALYPTPLSTVAYVPGTNAMALAPGETFIIPAGDWAINTKQYAFLQVLDPVLGIWLQVPTSIGINFIHSDGQNWRVANLTGCVVGATITAAGSGYTSAPTVTPSTGSSTWTAVVGGAISTTVTAGATAGSGYTVPPQVIVPAPPPGGVPAEIIATISAGAVSGYTVINQGAGYLTAPVPVLVTSPYDPNYNNVTAAAAPTLTLTGSGTVTALLCTNNGSAVVTAPTLTIAGGGGTGATATANMCNVIASIAVSGGTGYANTSLIYADGGLPLTGSVYTNPIVESKILYTRVGRGTMTAASGVPSAANVNIDAGIFSTTPTVVAIGGAPTATVTLTPTMGSITADFYLTPL